MPTARKATGGGGGTGRESKGFPLFDSFPALAELPRAVLGTFPSAIERVEVVGLGDVWLKRDDLNAPVAAGNKVRALEFLLGSVRPGDEVLTAGGAGSTHVYATAVHAARLGAETVAIRWPHEMHPTAQAVADAAAARCRKTVSTAWAGSAALRVAAWRAGLGQRSEGKGETRSRFGESRQAGMRHYVPIGGSSPLGILGHVNAGLELAAQVAEGAVPEPTYLVVPLGSGGTAAGLALGLGIAGLRTIVIAARVAPRVVANAVRIEMLVHGTRRLIRRAGRVRGPLRAARIVVEHHLYGGAYGRPLAMGARAGTLLRDACRPEDADCLPPVLLDATYAAKAGAAALGLMDRRAAGELVLLWVTFDGRAFGPPADAAISPVCEHA
jgi:D-cysteine desulfhydrase